MDTLVAVPEGVHTFINQDAARSHFKALAPRPAIMRCVERGLWIVFDPPSRALRHATAVIDEYGVHMARVYGIATSAKTRRRI